MYSTLRGTFQDHFLFTDEETETLALSNSITDLVRKRKNQDGIQVYTQWRQFSATLNSWLHSLIYPVFSLLFLTSSSIFSAVKPNSLRIYQHPDVEAHSAHYSANIFLCKRMVPRMCLSYLRKQSVLQDPQGH